MLTLARGSGPGAVSAYQYAFIFFQLPYGLIAVSIMTTILPDLSEAAKRHDVPSIRERFREGLAVLLTLLLPAAGAYLFLGAPLIEVLLQRGAFSAQDTRDTAAMLAGFSLGLPAFAVFLYCVRAFHARRNTRTPFWLNLFENALNVALVIPFLALFDQIGLSLAYAAAYWVAAITALVVLNRHVRGLLTWRGLAVFGRGVIVATLVIAAVLAVFLAVRPSVGPIVEIALALTTAAVVFGVATWVLRPYGFSEAIEELREGFARRAHRLRR